MQHVRLIPPDTGARLLRVATGAFYTPETVWSSMVDRVVSLLDPDARTISIVDPFCGDGRLVAAVISEHRSRHGRRVRWRVGLWDVDAHAVARARANVESLGVDMEVDDRIGDSFANVDCDGSVWDVVVTNPPWEQLKPDVRELGDLPASDRVHYVDQLRDYDHALTTTFVHAQPRRRFAGWGLNLSRVGTELSIGLLRDGGVLGIVVPTTLMTDTQSGALRRFVFDQLQVRELTSFDAERRDFDADVASLTIVGSRRHSGAVTPTTVRWVDRDAQSQVELALDSDTLDAFGWSLPIGAGAAGLELLPTFDEHPRFVDLEGDRPSDIWAGRELDETRIGQHLRPGAPGPGFVKGVHVRRFGVDWAAAAALGRIDKPGWSPPWSTGVVRVGWRDVSRRSQSRRMIPALLDPGWAAGNSINVAAFRDGDRARTSCLAAVLGSTCVELQVRARSATGHVSLATVRSVRVPTAERLDDATVTFAATVAAIETEPITPLVQARVDAAVARELYGLDESQYTSVLDALPGLEPGFRTEAIAAFRGLR